MAKTYAEEEHLFHTGLAAQLVAEGILEPGIKPGLGLLLPPDAVRCPHCGHVNRPESLLADQVVTCSGETYAAGGRVASKGCGQAFDVPAKRPMHQLSWCGVPPQGKPKVVAHWRKGVAEDHPARARYSELLGKFLADVN